jgi:hypothetical protein
VKGGVFTHVTRHPSELVQIKSTTPHCAFGWSIMMDGRRLGIERIRNGWFLARQHPSRCSILTTERNKLSLRTIAPISAPRSYVRGGDNFENAEVAFDRATMATSILTTDPNHRARRRTFATQLREERQKSGPSAGALSAGATGTARVRRTGAASRKNPNTSRASPLFNFDHF